MASNDVEHVSKLDEAVSNDGVHSTMDVPNHRKESTMRTHTVTIDAVSYKSSDVGVQATPVAVSADSSALPLKQQRGILPVTSDMRNSAARETRNHSDNHCKGMANTKEKTPMCQINELARFNKLPHKYVLVDEKGPAHKKEFCIRLDIGTENYESSGTSIKRAQHSAAEVALGITKLSRPPVKTPKVEMPPSTPDKKCSAPVTPTVELNALAMKLGERPEYTNMENLYTIPAPRIYRQYMYQGMPNYGPRHTMHPPRMFHPFYAPSPQAQAAMGFMPPHSRNYTASNYTVRLRLGKHEFKGYGPTRQLARHSAATKALKVLNNSPLQRRSASPPPVHAADELDDETHDSVTEESSNPTDTARAETPPPETCDGEKKLETSAKDTSTSTTSSNDGEESAKSEISLAHELALHYGQPITFEVIHESGPPHMRNFVTRSVCGDLVSEGEGNSKKQSKKMAAESMLKKLESQAQPVQCSKQKVKNVTNKKKNRNLIKMQKANIEYGCGINPISRLIQIQQANKRKEPVYSLVMEHGLPRRREFIIQVECNAKTCQGRGPNKKLAKRNAAEEMLQVMGYSKPSPPPGKSVLKSPDHSNHPTTQHNKHVTFSDCTTTGRLPGVIVRTMVENVDTNQEMPTFKSELAASLAKELLECGKSVVGETLLPAKDHPKAPLKRERAMLDYLGSCMGFAIDFTDFPKGTNTNLCLTLVTLRTNPPQVFHGSAATVELSHDKAATQALKKLAQSAPLDDEVTPPVALAAQVAKFEVGSGDVKSAAVDAIVTNGTSDTTKENTPHKKSSSQVTENSTVDQTSAPETAAPV